MCVRISHRIGSPQWLMAQALTLRCQTQPEQQPLPMGAELPLRDSREKPPAEVNGAETEESGARQ